MTSSGSALATQSPRRPPNSPTVPRRFVDLMEAGAAGFLGIPETSGVDMKPGRFPLRSVSFFESKGTTGIREKGL
eukprot:31749-Amorphochlora_amoeboformis.AAC.2